jgi:hypothetical protein
MVESFSRRGPVGPHVYDVEEEVAEEEGNLTEILRVLVANKVCV